MSLMNDVVFNRLRIFSIGKGLRHTSHSLFCLTLCNTHRSMDLIGRTAGGCWQVYRRSREGSFYGCVLRFPLQGSGHRCSSLGFGMQPRTTHQPRGSFLIFSCKFFKMLNTLLYVLSNIWAHSCPPGNMEKVKVMNAAFAAEEEFLS